MIVNARLIDVYWDNTAINDKKFEVDIEISSLDRPNLLNDVITVLGQMKVNMLSVSAGAIDKVEARISLKISVNNAEVLQQTIDNLHRIQGIYEIKRVIH